jgi:hypothetical protein
VKTQGLLQHIRDYFSDKSRSQEETMEGLNEARDEIDTLIDCIKNDLRNG